MVVYTLFQTEDAHPGLALDEPPAGLLSRGEAERFAGLRVQARRRSWLLGRWTAKLLLNSFFFEQTGKCYPLSNLEITNEPDGSPACYTGPAAVRLSISHSGSASFCAVTNITECGLGADLERIEPRPAGFAFDYFTPGEIEQAWRLTGAMRDQLVTAIWSGKEAALKALRLGLSVDTRAVDCGFLSGQANEEDWQPFQIRMTSTSNEAYPAHLAGWWRRQAYWRRQEDLHHQVNYIQTIAVSIPRSDQNSVAEPVRITSARLQI